MTDDDHIRERVAILEDRQKRLYIDVHALRSEMRDVVTKIGEQIAMQKAFKWVVTTAIATGPALGAILAKLL